MKDRILNVLMLLTVGLALALSLRGASPPSRETVSAVSAEPWLAPAADPVAAYRERRNALREKEEEALLALALDTSGDEALRDQARQAVMDLRVRMEKELAAEAAVIGRGFGDAVCTAAGDTLLIVLCAPIDAGEAAKMTLLVSEMTGVAAENIRIAC